MLHVSMSSELRNIMSAGQRYEDVFRESGVQWSEALDASGLSLHVRDMGRGVACFALISIIRQLDAGVTPDAGATVDEICHQLLDEPDGAKKLVEQYYEFMASIDTARLDPSKPKDAWRLFFMSRYHHLGSDFETVYPDVYYRLEREDPQAFARYQASTSQYASVVAQNLQIAADSAPQEGQPIRIANLIPDIAEMPELMQQLEGLYEQINKPLWDEADSRNEISFRLPGEFAALARMSEEELLRQGTYTRESNVMFAFIANLEGILPSSAARNHASNIDGDILKTFDLIFINGQSLRDYTAQHLPENQRTPADVSGFAGVMLAKAMAEGTNRISIGKLTNTGNGYQMTACPLKLDLTACQPPIRDDISYGWIRRHLLDWGPFKCKTRQEKADAALADESLAAKERAGMEKVTAAFNASEERRILKNQLQDMKTLQTAVSAEMQRRNENRISGVSMQNLALMFLDDVKCDGVSDALTFGRPVNEMLDAFQSGDREKIKGYLDRMADKIMNFDPDDYDPQSPLSVWRRLSASALSEASEALQRYCPDWYNERFPDKLQQERYSLKRMQIEVCVSEMSGKAKAVQAEIMNIPETEAPGLGRYGSFAEVTAMKDTLTQLDERLQSLGEGGETLSELPVKIPASCARYADMSPEQMIRLQEDMTDPEKASGKFYAALLAGAAGGLSGEARAIQQACAITDINGKVFYVDGKPLNEYIIDAVSTVTQGQNEVQARSTERDALGNSYAFLLNAILSGTHRVEAARLGYDQDGTMTVTPLAIRADLTECTQTLADGRTNADAAAELFSNDPDRQRRQTQVAASYRLMVGSRVDALNQEARTRWEQARQRGSESRSAR